ncbi:MAG: hypothetical protein LUO96_06710 [Methanomicrobiales archaeon]|nr:hypothetical protein [Methanomicrobiales archaeon]
MTWLEALVIILLVGIMFFLIYYYFRGAKGNIELRRPMESRVDEYLDRRFESIIEEYSLVRSPKLQGFRQLNEPLLAEDEARVQALRKAEAELDATLSDLGKRLDALEHEMAVPK